MRGLGVDLASVRRVARVHERFGARFERRFLHEREIAQLGRLPADSRPAFLAGRWAAKEAAYKAFAGWRVPFPEMEVRAAPLEGLLPVEGLPPRAGSARAPLLELHGSAKALAEHLGVKDVRLSLSHDEGMAVAAVVLC